MWGFIRNTLTELNLPSNFIKLDLNSITQVSIFVLWNGGIIENFTPTRGIRQGNPLSPYIFVLCLGKLSKMIQESVDCNCWGPLKLYKNLNLSHLFYADDVFLFGKASKNNIDQILKVLNVFHEISGLEINS